MFAIDDHINGRDEALHGRRLGLTHQFFVVGSNPATGSEVVMRNLSQFIGTYIVPLRVGLADLGIAGFVNNTPHEMVCPFQQAGRVVPGRCLFLYRFKIRFRVFKYCLKTWCIPLYRTPYQFFRYLASRAFATCNRFL